MSRPTYNWKQLSDVLSQRNSGCLDNAQRKSPKNSNVQGVFCCAVGYAREARLRSLGADSQGMKLPYAKTGATAPDKTTNPVWA